MRSFARRGVSDDDEDDRGAAQASAPPPAPAPDQAPQHEWDDDGCCLHCGFDGAEYAWWKTTYEGKARPDARMPLCRRRR